MAYASSTTLSGDVFPYAGVRARPGARFREWGRSRGKTSKAGGHTGGVSEMTKTRPQAGPAPEEIRWFGTTWVDHDGGYAWRRVAAAAGSLLAAAAGAFVLRLGFQGLADARIGSFVTALAFVGFAVCSVLAFQRTWKGFSTRRPAGGGAAGDNQGLYAIGFIGALLAYFVRSLSEAPGEALHRSEYEAALARRATARPKGRKRKR